MKSNTALFIIASTVLYTTILIYELFMTERFIHHIKVYEPAFPTDSYTHQLAKKSPEWKWQSLGGAQRRALSLRTALIAEIVFGFVAVSCIIKSIRQRIFRVTKYVWTLAKYAASHATAEYKEVQFLTVLLAITLLTAPDVGIPERLYMFLGKGRLIVVLVYLFLIVLVFPFFILAVFKLFRIFGSSMIIACYMAYVLEFLFTVFSGDDVDLTKMRQISIANFSPTVQHMIQSSNLENRVYVEIEPSENPNAALVSWGSYERIEIYGKFLNFKPQEFEAVLLHEIAHSKNESLLFKNFVGVFTVLLEMALMVYLYILIENDHDEDDMSVPATFIALYVIYFCSFKRWIDVLNRLTSQIAEMEADIIARNQSYGPQLANVLFKISMKTLNYIQAGTVYNMLKSDHPTIYQRIEYLGKPSTS